MFDTTILSPEDQQGICANLDSDASTCPSEPLFLANYSGIALQNAGIRLSATAQCFAARLLNTAYQGYFKAHQYMDISEDDAKAFAMDESCHGAETYGELRPEGFLDMLWKVGAKPGDRFYDLGSGTGKLVALAWLAGLNATGVELSSIRWDVSHKATIKLEEMKSLECFPQGGGNCPSELPQRSPHGLDFVWGSFLEVDFTDADVLFISSVMFNHAMMAKVANIARWMKVGSRIISYHNFAKMGQFEFPEFQKIGEFTEPTSWKSDTTWKLQEVVLNPVCTKQRPTNLKPPNAFESPKHCTIHCI